MTALATYEGDEKPAVRHMDKNGKVYGNWISAFQHAKIDYVGSSKNGSNAVSDIKKNVEKKMKGFGEGSRGVLQVFWKDGGGHVFNIENVHGEVWYVDAQTHDRYTPESVLSLASPRSVNLIRTDNLRVSVKAKDFVSKE